MRILIVLVVLTISAPGPAAQEPAAPAPAGGQAPAPAAAPYVGPRAVATMKELMLDLIYPTSDALFYVSRSEPKDTGEWMKLELTFLTLAESANLLMMPGRARDQGQWMKDAQLLLDVGRAAYRGAKARDFQALVNLNDQLYESCQSCHVNYRPGYRRRP